MTIDEYLDGRELARFPFAFIVTYGRSGSTLLQGILNAIDGYCIRGENDSTLFHLFCAVDAVARTRAVHTRLTATMPIDPWFGANDLDEATLSARLSSAFLEACLRPPERCRCTGFKEIRYLRPDIPDELFEPYLRFLQFQHSRPRPVQQERLVGGETARGCYRRDQSRDRPLRALCR